MFRRKKQQIEPQKQFQYTSLDSISPDINLILRFREVENERLEVENQIRGLIEKRKALIMDRNALLLQIQVPIEPIQGIEEAQPNPPQTMSIIPPPEPKNDRPIRKGRPKSES